MERFVRLSSQTWLFWLLTGLTLALHAPLLTHVGSAVPNDVGDPILNSWILWWNTQALPLTDAYWNAPIFAPAPNAFALSETLIGLTWLTTPLQWLGASPVAAHNIMFIATPVLSGMAAYWLCLTLTRRKDAAVLGAIAFAFAPYYANYVSHLQMRATFFMPIALVGLHRYWETGDRRWAVLMSAAVALNGLVCGYLLLYFAVFHGLAIVWLFVSTRDVGRLATVAAALIAAAAIIAPVAWKYREVRAEWHLGRSIHEIEALSADATSFTHGSRSLLLSARDAGERPPEVAQYPGVVLVGLIVITALVRPVKRDRPAAATRGWRTVAVVTLLGAALVFLAAGLVAWLGEPRAFRIGPLAISLAQPYKPIGFALDLVLVAILLTPRFTAAVKSGSLGALYTTGLVAGALLALGPVGKVFGHRFWYKAPFSWLMPLPGFDTARVPALFASIQILCLAVLGAFAFARLCPEPTRRARAVLAGLSIAIVLQGWSILEVVPVPRPSPAPLTADLVVELPMRGWVEDASAMYRAMTHQRPVMNGYSGYEPPHYADLRKQTSRHNFDALDRLRDGRSLDVVVWLNDPEGPDIDAALQAKWGSGIRETAGDAVIYRVR